MSKKYTNKNEQLSLNDDVLVSANTGRFGELRGIVTKINIRSFWIRINSAGHHKFIKRRYQQLIEVL